MFRIRKIFENNYTSIYKIEGKVTDEIMEPWLEGIAALNDQSGREVILDFCQVWFISRRAIEASLKAIQENFFLVNCPMEMRNVLHTAGLSARMLE